MRKINYLLKCFRRLINKILIVYHHICVHRQWIPIQLILVCQTFRNRGGEIRLNLIYRSIIGLHQSGSQHCTCLVMRRLHQIRSQPCRSVLNQLGRKICNLLYRNINVVGFFKLLRYILHVFDSGITVLPYNKTCAFLRHNFPFYLYCICACFRCNIGVTLAAARQSGCQCQY